MLQNTNTLQFKTLCIVECLSQKFSCEYFTLNVGLSAVYKLGKWLSCTTRYRTAEYFVSLKAKQLLSGDPHVKNQHVNLQTILFFDRTSRQVSVEIVCDSFGPENE